MAKRYRYDMKDGKYIVIEQYSDSIISTVTTKEKVKELVRLLNAGSGFNGQTPQFFIIPVGKNEIVSAKEKSDQTQTSV